MRAFRLSPKAHQTTAFSGEGARLAGGRWNHKGQRMVYCSESRALAALEYFVNLDLALGPPRLVFIQVQVPDGLIAELDMSVLPADWRTYPAPDSVKDIGSSWIERAESAALLVPSTVMPEERNLLLNPEHEDFRRIEIAKPRAFAFDARMWTGRR
jgi:RES domain-containing protein